MNNCYNLIGITGDRSCPELSNFIHCRNCPVYSNIGRQLLERTIPDNYRYEWTELFSEQRGDDADTLITTATLTVVIFRLQREWLALSTQVFKETISPTLIHNLPHRSNQILRGLVNIRGELQLCVSLTHLLNLETVDTPVAALSPVVYPRMVVVEKAGSVWVFPVDELYGVQRFHQHELRDTPNSMTATTHNFTKGFFYWRENSLGYLDEELLFTTLNRKVWR
ncbi:chemotaxis signal transduction protein [Nostoc sp. PCC 7524]|uniref:chemotaxis protein CheW n=1 Tax=Nostoc sp. (strain ATCC 29411 / PCC 7524) TaxID=28072 RepID=UPI00029EC40B|nr:chemotaxis protein CheW [Nostoc sp. PCC 7524]AFY48754.1 chemotaxis signal transduction protein [Nostoc sp. PCC 7524]